MNTIKNFFTWIFQWIMFGLILLALGWAYSTFIDDDKTTKKTAISKDDKLIEVEKTYWDNGNLKSETTYKKSYKVGWKKVKTTLIPHGVAKDYYESGVLKKEDPYVEGNRTGLVKLYLEDGSLEISSEYVNNKREGKTTFYEKDGSVSMTIFYKNDLEVVEKKKGLDALYEDMPYSEARKVLLNAGWKGDDSEDKDLFGQGKVLYVDNNWTEVMVCAMSAGSPCRYEFTKNQKKLVLITLGECFNEEGEMCELTMTQWFFE